MDDEAKRDRAYRHLVHRKPFPALQKWTLKDLGRREALLDALLSDLCQILRETRRNTRDPLKQLNDQIAKTEKAIATIKAEIASRA